MDPPTITVIIPARNAAATLATTLDSLLAQSFADWQAIIIDDGSTDDTAAIIQAYKQRDPRFSSLNGPGKGVSGARNLGIAMATGKWLHFLDADDWNDPEFYQKLLVALAASPGAMAAYCGYRRVMPGGVITPTYPMPDPKDPFEEFVRGCLIAIHSVLIDREIVVRLGAFDTSLGICEDWDLWQRVTRFDRPWVPVPEGLAYYRTAGPSLSSNVELMLANSKKIITRGFGVDERLVGMAPAREAGGSAARGSIEQALAYNAIWTLGMDCGAGGSCNVEVAVLAPYREAAKEANIIATVLRLGLMVGLRALPEEMAARWPQFGTKLTGLINWLAQLWDDTGAARAIQYHIEEQILYSEKFTVERQFSLTRSVRVDVVDPPFTVLPEGVDRLYACFVEGEEVQAVITLAALGDFTRLQWRQVRGIELDFGYQQWRQWHARHARAANLRFLRHAAGAVMRRPGLLRRRSQYRPTVQMLRDRTWRSLSGPIDAPGSHAERLSAIKTWAANDARSRAGTGPVQPQHRHEEGIVDPAYRRENFERLFEKEDPWNYGSPYERQKYQRQLEVLPDGPIPRALELACAEGHFTVQLAARVGALLATDISPTALTRAEQRCAVHGNIKYQALDLSNGPMPTDMDLIFCSEVLYYLSGEAELRQVANRIFAALRPGGCFVTAHAHVLTDDPSRTGFDWGVGYGSDFISRVFSEIPGLVLERSIETELYRIDRFRRVDGTAHNIVPQLETLPLVEELDVSVARYVVWGGASMRRSDAWATEQRSQVPVLMYHGISETGPQALARYRIDPALFQAQIRWLRAHGYYSIGSEQLAAHLQSREPFPGRPVMLTFDDGFQDFADHAWPTLAAHDFTAEMFVVTGRVGGAAIWDADKGEPTALMDSPTIARLAAQGALFGSHSATHRPIDGLSSRELAEELASSHAMLEQWLGRPPVSFAAPYGITDNRLGGMAVQCGYSIGFGGGQGVVRLEMNPLDLPRIEIRGDRGLDDFIRLLQAQL